MDAPRKQKQTREALEKIAADFRALSEPMRLAILQELKSGGATVGELVEALSASQPNISKHLKVLFDANFLGRKQEGNRVYYTIKDEMVLQLCELVCNRLNRRARKAAPHYSI